MASPEQPGKGGANLAAGMAHSLRALRHRNYRLFFGGQGISMIGSWMQGTALQLLVFGLATERYGAGDRRIAFMLGLVGFSSQIMTFIISPFAGVIIDRFNLRRLIIATQSLATLQAAVLAALTLTGVIRIELVIVLAMLLGVVMAFDITGRQSFVVQMVGRREDLPNAIALNSSLVNGAKLIGPAIAGFVVFKVGEGMCFLANAISYLFVIAALFAMRVEPRPAVARHPNVLRGLHDGWRYAFGFAPVRSILMLMAFVSLTGMAYTTLLPIFADRLATPDALGWFWGKVLAVLAGSGGPRHGVHDIILGFLIGATGLGALAGALFLATRRSVLGLGRWIALAPAIFGGALVAFACSPWLWLSLPLLAVAGFGMMTQMASSNTILQTVVDDDKRGRVMSLYTMSFMGMGPFGSLILGGLATGLGAPAAVGMAGAACILGSILFATRLPMIRAAAEPVYVRLGILPPRKAAATAPAAAPSASAGSLNSSPSDDPPPDPSDPPGTF